MSDTINTLTPATWTSDPMLCCVHVTAPNAVELDSPFLIAVLTHLVSPASTLPAFRILTCSRPSCLDAHQAAVRFAAVRIASGVSS